MLHNTFNGRHPQYGVVGMINDNLGTQGYQVVRALYDNLMWLHNIYEHLPNIIAVQNNTPHLERVSQYLDSIYEVQMSLREIIELNANLPLVQELAPRIAEFNTQLSTVRTEISSNQENVTKLQEQVTSMVHSFDVMFNDFETKVKQVSDLALKELNETVQKSLCGLETQRLYVENLYKQIQEFVPMYEKVANNQSAINSNMAHLNATDAVTLATFTNNEDDKAEALKVIKYSEKLGNNEDINRARLGYKLPKHNVFKVLSDNYQRLGGVSSGIAKAPTGKVIVPDCGCSGGCNV